MKASRAAFLAGKEDRIKRPLATILNQIEELATAGNLSLNKYPVMNYDIQYTLKLKLEALGYKVSAGSVQINESDYYLSVSWDHA